MTAFLSLKYSECSKFSNSFLFVLLKYIVGTVFRAEIHRMHVRSANREDHDQTAS